MTDSSFATLVIDAVTAACALIRIYLPTDASLVRVSVIVWAVCLVCMSPAVCRIAFGRSRSLDPIWGLMTLLVVNRLSFLLHVSREVSHLTAILLAIGSTIVTVSYQRWDGKTAR